MSDTIVPLAPVAVIGLGNMGVPMGACLIKAGYAVTGFDLLEPARQRFAAAGGRVANDIAGAVAGAQAVIMLLPNGKIVREAVSAMRPHLAAGTILMDMSSSDPIGTRSLGEELSAAGTAFIDAPVSGGVRRAETGTLAIMVGGEGAIIDRVQPLLSAMGGSIFRTGALGSGHAMKALNNYVSAAGLVAACEAVVAGSRFGLKPDVIIDIINASSGMNNSTQNKFKQFILSKTWGAGFMLGLMAKDLRTALEVTAATGTADPLAQHCVAIWNEAEKKLGGGADHTEIFRYIETLHR
jgi:3-hydroxyisobutyrate dehydrogenase